MEQVAAVQEVLSTLQSASRVGPDLSIVVNDLVVQAGGWNEWVATAILSALEKVLSEGGAMNQAMKDAYDRARKEASKMEAFAHDHPILVGLFLTVVAFGVLAILAPIVLEALGFAEEGIVAGKFLVGLEWLDVAD